MIIGNELSFLWHSVLDQAENPLSFQNFMQLVTRRVIDVSKMKTAFIFETAQTEESTNIHLLKAEEEHTLCYVAGYIPKKLKLQYKKKNSVRALKYMEHLNSMNKEEGSDIEFLRYTKLWVEQVNRGGLLIIRTCFSEL